jgi:hypothetical protein
MWLRIVMAPGSWKQQPADREAFTFKPFLHACTDSYPSEMRRKTSRQHRINTVMKALPV